MLLDRAGRAGEMCARADGRELWVLGEMYDVGSMREWLLDEGIDGSNLGASYEFGLVPEGVEREGIIESCLAVVQNGGLGVVDEAGMRGVGRETAKGLALARARQNTRAEVWPVCEGCSACARGVDEGQQDGSPHRRKRALVS